MIIVFHLRWCKWPYIDYVLRWGKVGGGWLYMKRLRTRDERSSSMRTFSGLSKKLVIVIYD